jgi:hypothetical protein
MVDEEPLSNLSSRVDVDAGQRVSDLGDDPREQKRAEPVELMRQAVAHDRGDPGKQKITLSMLFADGSFAKAARALRISTPPARKRRKSTGA